MRLKLPIEASIGMGQGGNGMLRGEDKLKLTNPMTMNAKAEAYLC